MQTKTFAEMFTFSRPSIATYVNSAGDIVTAAANEPRYEFHPLTGIALGLKMEAGRTNSAANSEVFAASTGTTVSSNAVVAPDGTATGDTIIENTSNSEHYTNDISFTPAASSNHTWSVWAKRGAGSRNVALRMAGANVASANFNFDTKVFVTSGAQFVRAGYEEYKNGWFRLWMTVLPTSLTSTVFRLQLISGSTTTVYTGDGTSGITFWGRQLEVGSHASSYVKTTGSPVTRSADSILTQNISANLRTAQGTFYMEGDYQSPDNREGSAIVASSSARALLRRISGQGSAGFYNDAKVVQYSAIGAPTVADGAPIRQALAYAPNNFQSATNGTLAASSVVGTTSELLNAIRVYSTIDGHVKRIKYFPYRLSSDELRALTL